jgi:hypothetical protein
VDRVLNRRVAVKIVSKASLKKQVLSMGKSALTSIESEISILE